jgi:DNA-binding XRE family transcriptional regulator
MVECNHDCLNCPYPDAPEECLEGPLSLDDYRELDWLDREIIRPKTERQKKASAKQKAYYEANREEIAAKRRAYREANREEIAAKQKAYYEANREEIAAKQKAYREANREEIAAKQKAYYEANREEIAAKQKAYREANREEIAAKRRAYREANREEIAAKQKAIADVRRARRMTQRDLATLCGVTQPAISQWESGCLPAPWDKLCAVLPELEQYRPNKNAADGTAIHDQRQSKNKALSL